MRSGVASQQGSLYPLRQGIGGWRRVQYRLTPGEPGQRRDGEWNRFA
jgi:hypothetical protein